MEEEIKKYLYRPPVARAIVRFALRLHNFSYRIAGEFSQGLEPDGLHPKHRLLNYHQWFIEQIQPSWDVLDVGCGNGALTQDLSRHCRYVLGIDKSKEKIEEAKRRCSAEFICADATGYVFERRFDAVVLSNVLEHIEDRVGFLKKLKCLTGIFLIRVPMLDRDWITLYKKELGLEYRLDPTHFIEYTLDIFKKELDEAGLILSTYRVCFGELYAVVKVK